MHGLVGPSIPLSPSRILRNGKVVLLVAVQDLHRELNFPLQLNKMHRLQKVLTGIKRLSPARQLDRFPTALQILHAIYSYFQPKYSQNLDQVMLLAFFGFLRSSKFTCNTPFDPSVHLTARDMTLVPNSHSPSHMLDNPKLTPSGNATPSPELVHVTHCSVMAMKD